MAKKVVSRLRELMAIKERRQGYPLSQRQVAKETGLAKTTVDRYARNDAVQFDQATILALCEYFGCEVGDLLVIEEVESPEMKNLLAAAS